MSWLTNLPMFSKCPETKPHVLIVCAYETVLTSKFLKKGKENKIDKSS